MISAKFIVSGEDRQLLAGIKNVLAANGHIYLGYSKEPFNILRHIRSNTPDLIIIEACNKFKELKPILEIIDEELLTACILILDIRSDEVLELLGKSRVITYVTKPAYNELVLQIADSVLVNFKRVLEYEQKIKKLNNTLESRKYIEKAKWLLVEQEGMTEAEALEVLRKKSRDNRMSMREIAEAIILTRG